MAGILGDALRGALREVLGEKLGKSAGNAAAEQVGERLDQVVAASPKLKNAMSLESLFRSRVAAGTSGATILAAIIVFQKWEAREFDDVFFMSLGVAATAGYGFLGRALNWSGPMWSRLGRWISGG